MAINSFKDKNERAKKKLQSVAAEKKQSTATVKQQKPIDPNSGLAKLSNPTNNKFSFADPNAENTIAQGGVPSIKKNNAAERAQLVLGSNNTQNTNAVGPVAQQQPEKKTGYGWDFGHDYINSDKVASLIKLSPNKMTPRQLTERTLISYRGQAASNKYMQRDNTDQAEKYDTKGIYEVNTKADSGRNLWFQYFAYRATEDDIVDALSKFDKEIEAAKDSEADVFRLQQQRDRYYQLGLSKRSQKVIDYQKHRTTVEYAKSKSAGADSSVKYSDMQALYNDTDPGLGAADIVDLLKTEKYSGLRGDIRVDNKSLDEYLNTTTDSGFARQDKIRNAVQMYLDQHQGDHDLKGKTSDTMQAEAQAKYDKDMIMLNNKQDEVNDYNDVDAYFDRYKTGNEEHFHKVAYGFRGGYTPGKYGQYTTDVDDNGVTTYTQTQPTIVDAVFDPNGVENFTPDQNTVGDAYTRTTELQTHAGFAKYMSGDQQDMFSYIYRHEGEEAAEEYLNKLENTYLGQAKTEALEEAMAAATDWRNTARAMDGEADWKKDLEQTGKNTLWLGAKAVSTLISPLAKMAVLGKQLRGEEIGRFDPTFDIVRWQNATVEGVASHADNMIPVEMPKELGGGGAAGFMVRNISSTLDNLVQEAAVMGLGVAAGATGKALETIIKVGTLDIMANQVFVQELYAGYSDPSKSEGQVWADAGASAVIEILSETVLPFDQMGESEMFAHGGSFKKLFATMIAEGGEEVSSDAMNAIYNYVAHNEVESEKVFQQYLADYNGDVGQAMKMTAAYIVGNEFMAFAGGATSAAASGVVGMTTNAIRQNGADFQTGNQIFERGDRSVSESLRMIMQANDPSSKEYKSAEKMLKRMTENGFDLENMSDEDKINIAGIQQEADKIEAEQDKNKDVPPADENKDTPPVDESKDENKETPPAPVEENKDNEQNPVTEENKTEENKAEENSEETPAEDEEKQNDPVEDVKRFFDDNRKNIRQLGKIFRKTMSTISGQFTEAFEAANAEKVQSLLENDEGSKGISKVVIEALSAIANETATTDQVDAVEAWTETHPDSIVTGIVSDIYNRENGFAPSAYTGEAAKKAQIYRDLFLSPFKKGSAEYYVRTADFIKENTAAAAIANAAGDTVASRIGRVNKEGSTQAISPDGHSTDIKALPTEYKSVDGVLSGKTEINGVETYVAVDSLVGANDTEGAMIGAITAYSGQDANVANAISAGASGFSGGISGYVQKLDQAQKYGFYGLTEGRVMEMLGTDNKAVNDAIKAVWSKANEARNAVNHAQRNRLKERGEKTTGKVNTDSIKGKQLNHVQKNVVAMLNGFVKTGAMNISLFDSNDSNGFADGQYDPNTNTVYLDISAGKSAKDASSVAGQMMGKVFSHELTHYIQSNNAEGYQQLVNILNDALRNGGKESLNKFINDRLAAYEQRQIKLLERRENGTQLSEDEQKFLKKGTAELTMLANDEAVANACEFMLRDSKIVQEVAQSVAEQNKTLAQKILDFINRFVERVKNAFNAYSKAVGSAEAKALYETGMKNIQAVQKAWDDALRTAMQSAKTETENATESANEAESRFSEKMDQDYMAAVEADDMETAQKLVDEAARKAGYLKAGYHGTTNGGFTVFDRHYASAEGNSGAGFYFSTTQGDSEANYADIEGADNQNKAERLAEQILDMGEWDGEEVDDYDDALEIAKNEMNKNPQTYSVYLDTGKNYIRDFKNTTNLADEIYDDFDEEEYDIDDYDDEDEYYDEVYEAKSNAAYEKIEQAVYHAMRELQDRYDYVDAPDESDITSTILGKVTEEEILTWDDLTQAVEYMEVQSEDGNTQMGSNEFARLFIEAFGYNSITDKEVSKKFNMGGTNADTEHIIVFKSEQIKLSDPVTRDDNGDVIPLSERFNSDEADIRYSNKVDKAGLSPMERAEVYSRIGKIAAGESAQFERTKDGQYIFAIGNKLVYNNGDINSPYVSQVTKIMLRSNDRIGAVADLIYLCEKGEISDGSLREILENTLRLQRFGKTVRGVQQIVYRKDRNRTRKDSKEAGARNREQVRTAQEVNAETRESEKASTLTDRDLLRMASDAVAQTETEREYLKMYRESTGEMSKLNDMIEGERENIERFKKAGNTSELTKATNRLNVLQQQFDRAVEKSSKLEESKPLAGVMFRIRQDTEAAVLDALTQVRDANTDVQAAIDAQVAKYKDEVRDLKSRISKLKAENKAHTQQRDNAKVKTSESNESVRQLEAALESTQNKLAALQQKYAKDIAKEVQKRENALSRMRSQREASATRKKIRRIIDNFNTRLKRPNANQYIPVNMVRGIVDALESFDLSYVRNGEEKVSDKIAQMQGIYDSLKDDETYKYQHTDFVSEQLKILRETMGDTPFRNLSNEQLDHVYAVMKSLHKTITEANQLKSGDYARDIFDAVRKMIEETDAADPALKGRAGEYINWQLTPIHAFKRFGGYAKNSTWEAAAQSLIDSEKKYYEIQRTAQQFFQDLAEQKEFENLTKHSEKDLVDVGLVDMHTGKAVKITRGMMLSIYMHLANEDNRGGIMRGGFTIPGIKEYYNGKRGLAYSTGRIRTAGISQDFEAIREEMFKDGKIDEAKYEELEKAANDKLDAMQKVIEGELTEFERKLIDRVHEWNDHMSRDMINEVTMDLYGFKKASVDNYYPIHRDSKFLNGDFESIKRDYNIENAGFLKERVKASQPILLTDICNEMSGSINGVATYVGYVRAQRDFGKMFSGKLPGFTKSVKDSIAHKFGAGKDHALGVTGDQYIENLMADITGSRQRSEKSIFAAVRRNLPRATLSMNIKVALSQLASLPTSAPALDYGTVVRGMVEGAKIAFSKEAKDKIANESVWFWQRYRGEGGMVEFHDMQSGGNIIDRAYNKVNKATKGYLLNWCQNFDVAATSIMHRMAEIWVDNNTDLHKGTDEYLAAVDKKYSEVLLETQPMYTTTGRSDVMRSTSELMKFLTMYKTQANQNMNILYDATASYRKMKSDLQKGLNGVTQEDKEKAKSKMIRSYVTVCFTSPVTFAILGFIGSALTMAFKKYKDDDDEVTLKSAVNGIVQEAISSVASMYVLGGDLYDIAKSRITGDRYYGMEETAIGVINDIATSLAQDDLSNPSKVKKLTENFASVFGIPITNAEKYIKAANGWIGFMKDGEFFKSAQTDHTYIARMYDAAMKDDLDAFTENVQYLSAAGMEQSSMDTKFTNYVKSKFNDGKIKAEEAERLLVDYAGKTEGNAHFAVEGWKFDQENDKVTVGEMVDTVAQDFAVEGWKSKLKNGKKDKYDKFSTLKEALTSGDDAAAMAAYEELISYGITDETIKNQIANVYKDGGITREKAVNTMVKMGSKEETAYWTIDKAEYTAANGDAEGYRKTIRLEDALASGNESAINTALDEIDMYTTTTQYTAVLNSVMQLYVDKRIDWNKAEELLKKYGLIKQKKMANTLYWFKEEADYKIAHPGESFDKYGKLYSAIESGNANGISEATKELINHGETKKTIGGKLKSKYADRYKRLLANNPAEAERLMVREILPAFKAIGYSEAQERAIIKRDWL